MPSQTLLAWLHTVHATSRWLIAASLAVVMPLVWAQEDQLLCTQRIAKQAARRTTLAAEQEANGADSEQVLTALDALATSLSCDLPRRDELRAVLERRVVVVEKLRGERHPEFSTNLNELVYFLIKSNNFSAALPLARRALAIRELTLGPVHLDVAVSLTNLAFINFAMDDFAEALLLFQRSLAIREKVPRPNYADVAASLGNLAAVHKALGNMSEAVALAERALTIAEKQMGRNIPMLALTYDNLGSLLIDVGDFTRALSLLQRGLALRTKWQDANHEDLALSFNNLGVFYLEMGNHIEARRYFQRSLTITEMRSGPSDSRIALSLNNLATSFTATGDFVAAFPLYLRSQQIFESVFGADHQIVAMALSNMALLKHAMGHNDEALSLFQRGLAIREKAVGPDHIYVAGSHLGLGTFYLDKQDYELAQMHLLRAITLTQSSYGYPGLLWRSQHAASLLNTQLQQPELAILWGKQAVNTIQDLRSGLTTLDKGLQSGFLIEKRHVYQHLADLLISEGRLAEAQTVLQMLKEQELHDSLERAAKTDPRTTRIEPTDQERQRFAEYDKLRQQQLALGQERELLERKKQLGTINPDEQRRLEEIKTRLLPPLQDGTLRFLEALQKDAAKLARQEKRSTDTSVRLVETNLQKAMQQVRQSDPQAAVAALQYVVTDSRLSILLSAPGAAPIARQIDLGAKELRQKVMAAREIVSRPPSTRPDDSAKVFLNKPLRELYALLIAPVEADIKKLGATTLILVPNDVLRYVPFAALMNGDRYLVQDYTLALFNEAAKRDFAARMGGKSHLAAMGLTRALPEANLSALPAVRKEVETVALRSGLLGKVFLDDDFTRPALMGVLGADFNMLHLASHFEFKPGRPDASRLFLGDRSTLTLGDIARDNMRFDRFSLVTFSACETGLGDTELADGRDMESLGALVQNQGAQAVVATLWKAEDQSAASLMEAFYRSRGAGKLGTAKALRAAQLQLIESGTSTHARSHPYFWAPFVLMGDWR